jgi:hypothetical protein
MDYFIQKFADAGELVDNIDDVEIVESEAATIIDYNDE